MPCWRDGDRWRRLGLGRFAAVAALGLQLIALLGDGGEVGLQLKLTGPCGCRLIHRPVTLILYSSNGVL